MVTVALASTAFCGVSALYGPRPVAWPLGVARPESFAPGLSPVRERLDEQLIAWQNHARDLATGSAQARIAAKAGTTGFTAMRGLNGLPMTAAGALEVSYLT